MRDYDPGEPERPQLRRVRVFFVVLFGLLFAANLSAFCVLSGGLAFFFGLLAAGCGFAMTVAWQERVDANDRGP